MNCEASWFDANAYPRLSFLLNVFVVTLMFIPFVLVRLYYWAISDIGAEPNPFPAPLLGLSAAFALSLPCACSAVLAYRFIARYWKDKRNTA
jgi:hypothetical protein